MLHRFCDQTGVFFRPVVTWMDRRESPFKVSYFLYVVAAPQTFHLQPRIRKKALLFLLRLYNWLRPAADKAILATFLSFSFVFPFSVWACRCLAYISLKRKVGRRGVVATPKIANRPGLLFLSLYGLVSLSLRGICTWFYHTIDMK